MHPHSESDQIFIFLPGSSCKLDELGLRGCGKSQGHKDGILNRGGEEKAEVRAAEVVKTSVIVSLRARSTCGRMKMVMRI